MTILNCHPSVSAGGFYTLQPSHGAKQLQPRKHLGVSAEILGQEEWLSDCICTVSFLCYCTLWLVLVPHGS